MIVILWACLALAVAAPSVAGDFHQSIDLRCSDCHAQHYTESGTPAGWQPGGPFPGLLVAASTNHLCLFCHDGSDPDAPDVMHPVSMYDATGDATSAGGYFSGFVGGGSPLSHDLGAPTPTPLRIDGAVMALSCASCHAVHGNDLYRNLRSDPDSTKPPMEIRVGTHLFLQIRPANPPDRATTIEAYRSSNTGYASGMGEWCTRCHDAIATDEPGSPPSHHRRHPSGAAIALGNDHLDAIHWVGGSGNGFGTAAGDEIAGVPRVRFQNPGATGFAQSRTVGPTNEVFCGSCHLAHGGAHARSLTWPYREEGADHRAACQQCHNR